MEIDLMANYPKARRAVLERGSEKTEADRALARQFGRDFFDGDRRVGYGGYEYHPRFWEPVVPTVQEHFGLKAGMRLLDVGCGKGFMLYDFRRLIPGLEISGLDVSEYAIQNAKPEVKDYLQVGNALNLPYPDKAFDVTISITTIHNLDRAGCVRALNEIERVSRKGSFVTVDAYRNEEEKRRMMAWNLTAQTVLHVDEWVAVFEEAGYTGDYYWFIP